MKVESLPGCARLGELFGLIVAILREIFDESAYQRFLDRGQLQSSASAYAVFLRENELTQARRPRCC
jgi:hypothetical protein